MASKIILSNRIVQITKLYSILIEHFFVGDITYLKLLTNNDIIFNTCQLFQGLNFSFVYPSTYLWLLNNFILCVGRYTRHRIRFGLAHLRSQLNQSAYTEQTAIVK